MAQAPPIDLLLNLVAERPETVLTQLQAHPELAGKQDAHGYSLFHAAASYGHQDLLRSLIRDYEVDPNIKDEDGETALFNVEDVTMAKLVIELGTDMALRNNEGQLAAEKLDDEDEQPVVAAFLREAGLHGSEGATSALAQTGAADASASAQNGILTNGASLPSQLPDGVQINVGTMQADEVGEEPDPEFRRRIEELAARGDFEGEEGQRALRNLVTDALSDFTNSGEGPPSSRRRLD